MSANCSLFMSDVKRSIKLISLFKSFEELASAKIIFVHARLVTNPATGPIIALFKHR